MAKGINIEFVSDVRRFLSGTKDLGKSLDDVADSLDDLSKDAERAGEKMGKSLEEAGDEAKTTGKKIGDEIEDGAEKAEDSAKRLERKFRDAFDDVSGKARKAGDEVGDETKRGFGRAEQAAEGFRDEARQNFAETASSFDGSMDSIADLAQSTFGGLATAIPGAGIALAALGAAAGVFYQQWAENAEKTKARISEMYDDMLESGNRFLSAQYINEGISKILHDDEDAILRYSDAQQIATSTGVDLQTVVRAYAGDAESAATVSTALAAAQAELGDQSSSTNFVLNSAVDTLAKVTDNTATAAEKAEVYTGAQVTSAEAARDFAIAQASVGEATAAAQEKIAANNQTIADGTERARQNDAALAELAGELGGVNEAARAAGVSGARLNQVEEEQYGAFMAAARAAGFTERKARDMARQFGLVPRNVTTNVSTPGMDAAIARAEKLAQMVRNVPSRKVITFEGRTIGTGNLVGFTPGTGVPIYGAARASGGPVEAGETYLVGEHGPEVVTMGKSGSVTRNVDVGGRGGVVELGERSMQRMTALMVAATDKVSAAKVADNSRGRALAGRQR